MKSMEINLEKIARLAEQREDENYRFRVFLKGQDDDQIDIMVHKMDKEIRSQIDCDKCGNCCIHLNPSVTDEEIKKLSRLEHLSPLDFVAKYVDFNDRDRSKYLKDLPCKYLNEKKCSLNSNKPEECQAYPHTQNGHFIHRTFVMIDNYGICPIVFNLFEQLKMELNFKK